MTTLRRRVAWRFGTMVVLCLFLLAGIVYHELVHEAELRAKCGLAVPGDVRVAEMGEVLLYAGMVVVFVAGWWAVRRSLRPIDELAAGVDRYHVANLDQRLPRTFNGDEVDRMSAAFNAMAARVQQSFQQVREFTLHASHELKTPLTVMRAELDTALARPDELTAAQRKVYASLHEEVLRLSRIVDGLTLLTKAEAGLLALQRGPVRLDELVREAAEDAAVLGRPGGVTARLAACDARTVDGDRHRLRQVLLNLVDNAVKYNRPGGWVELALRGREGAAEVTVTNTGPGIAPELQGRVFDRFMRGEASHSREVPGCGLGLSIARWIVEAHGGRIECASVPDQTTTFTVRLPGAAGSGDRGTVISYQ